MMIDEVTDAKATNHAAFIKSSFIIHQSSIIILVAAIGRTVDNMDSMDEMDAHEWNIALSIASMLSILSISKRSRSCR